MHNTRNCYTYAFASDQNVVIAALPIEHALSFPRRANAPRTRIVTVGATGTSTTQNKLSYKQLEQCSVEQTQLQAISATTSTILVTVSSDILAIACIYLRWVSKCMYVCVYE